MAGTAFVSSHKIVKNKLPVLAGQLLSLRKKFMLAILYVKTFHWGKGMMKAKRLILLSLFCLPLLACSTDNKPRGVDCSKGSFTDTLSHKVTICYPHEWNWRTVKSGKNIASTEFMPLTYNMATFGTLITMTTYKTNKTLDQFARGKVRSDSAISDYTFASGIAGKKVYTKGPRAAAVDNNVGFDLFEDTYFLSPAPGIVVSIKMEGSYKQADHWRRLYDAVLATVKIEP